MKGRTVLVIVAIAGIVAAMATAALMVAVTQSLGRQSQETASGIRAPPEWEIRAGHVRYAEGAPVELVFVVAHGSGPAVDLDNVTLTVDTGLGIWAADGITWVPVRDDDGSVVQGVSQDGDLFDAVIPLEAGDWPPARVIDVAWHDAEVPIGRALVASPANQEQGVRAIAVA